MRVALITSTYGGYDQVAAPAPQDIDCEFIVVSDRPVDCWPWKPVVEPRPQLHPRLAAKVAKCRPDAYTDAEATIWVDGHVRITSAGFARWAITPLEHADLAQLRHPFHRRLTEEAALSARLPKYAGLPVGEQVAFYLERGYPDDWGLWAGGLIARRTSAAVRAFGDAWLAEQVRWTYQDQLSEAPVLHRLGMRPADLRGPLVGHPLFALATHADGSG